MDYFNDAVSLLRELIACPSFSNEEDNAAAIWEKWLSSKGVANVGRFHNNVYALSEKYDPSKPILLINSHLDTVRPASSYTRDPFSPDIEDGKLYGLGSNDAGGAGVAMAAAFIANRLREDLPFNMLLAISASEEKMGDLGMRILLPHLKEKGLYPDMAIVGEPTGCRAAIAERGLVVCDAVTTGKAGHAARNEGINAIYRACDDIRKIQNFKWTKQSEILGPVKATVTMIDAGTQHNAIPDKCHFVVDIRTTDAFTNEETVNLLQQAMEWTVLTPRSTRIRASALPLSDPLAIAALKSGMETYVSPTTSDMANMTDFPSIKIGPGESERSHSANEYIKLDEIKQGIHIYNRFIDALASVLNSVKNDNKL